MAESEKPILNRVGIKNHKLMEAQFNWSLEAYEEHGNLHLKWNTTAPFRAQQGWVCVYSKEEFPVNPNDNKKKWSWDNENKPAWDTGLPWGTGWYCAYIAEASPNGPYVYFMKLITTKDMGPNVAKRNESLAQ